MVALELCTRAGAGAASYAAPEGSFPLTNFSPSRLLPGLVGTDFGRGFLPFQLILDTARHNGSLGIAA